MKEIDWQLVCSDPNLSHRYAVEVKNRFDILSQESDDIDLSYQKLSQATEEIAISTLPKRKKQKNSGFQSNALVKDARQKVEDACKRCESRPTRRALSALSDAQKELDDAYLTAEAAYISGEIANLSSLHHAQRHAASWKVINKLTGRKEKPTAKLKGGSSENRKSLWFDHFSKLLGQEPSTSDDDLPKIEISKDLAIKTGPFNLYEMQHVVNPISNNKSPGPDFIPTII